jgi:hypothetical protein
MSSILAEQDISAHQSKLYSTSERVYITTLTMTLSERIELWLIFQHQACLLFFVNCNAPP